MTIIPKVRGPLTNLSLHAEARGLFSCSLTETPATRTCVWGLGKCNKNYSFRHGNEESPWRSNSTPLGAQGLHPAGALARTHRNLNKLTPIPTKRVETKPRQTLRGNTRTPPEGRGLLSGTLEWGTPSKTSNGLPKSHLKNNDKSKKVSRGSLPVANRPTGSSSSSPRALRRRSRHPGEAPQGRPRQGTPSPPRPRLSTEGLGRRRVLRIT